MNTKFDLATIPFDVIIDNDDDLLWKLAIAMNWGSGAEWRPHCDNKEPWKKIVNVCRGHSDLVKQFAVHCPSRCVFCVCHGYDWHVHFDVLCQIAKIAYQEMEISGPTWHLKAFVSTEKEDVVVYLHALGWEESIRGQLISQEHDYAYEPSEVLHVIHRGIAHMKLRNNKE